MSTLYEKLAKKKQVSVLSGKGVKGLAKNLGALGLVAGAAALGIKGVATAADTLSDPVERKIGLKRTLKANPDLKKYDKKDLQRGFRTIHHFSPRVASDPMAAGATLRRFMAYKDVGPQTPDIKTLAEIEKGHAARKSVIRDGLAMSNISGISNLG